MASLQQIAQLRDRIVNTQDEEQAQALSGQLGQIVAQSSQDPQRGEIEANEALAFRRQQQGIQGPHDFDPNVARRQAPSPGSLAQAAGQSAGASRFVPEIDPIVATAESIGQIEALEGTPGFDINNEADRIAVEKEVRAAMAAGKPVDAEGLRNKIQGAIHKNKVESLQRGEEVAGLEAKISDAQDKVEDNLAEGVKLPAAVKQKLFTQIHDKLTMSSGLKAINRMADDSFFNLFTQAKVKALALAEKSPFGITKEQKSELGRFKAFQSRVEGMFAQYVKSISGAAVSEAEFTRLKKAFINMELSPTQFKATMEGLQAGIAIDVRMHQLGLKTGGDTDKLKQLMETDPQLQGHNKKVDDMRNTIVELGRQDSRGAIGEMTDDELMAALKEAPE
jgi:hypothetical protein